MREIEHIASALFDKIRSRFTNLSIGNENAKSVQDPENARFFNFEYVDKDGTSFGNVTISLIDENSLKVYFSKDITDSIDDAHKDEWYAFLRGIRQFAKRNMLTFDTRDIARSNLQLKDIKQQSKSDSVLDTDDITVTESRLFGTSRSSYQDYGPVKIIVRHLNNVDETKRGSRSRNIDCLFLETQNGERRILPFKNLHGARAMAKHCGQGGQIDDQIGESITAMCKEMSDMAHFVRSTKNREFEDRETTDMAKAAVQHYGDLKRKLRGLSTQRGYNEYLECYMPEGDIEEEIDVDALRERFVKKVYDDRFEEALPYVYRAYQKQKAQQNNPMAEEFETWADQVTEGTWALPDSVESVEDLDRVMAKPLDVGDNADNVTGILYNIIGDDALFDKLGMLADEQGPGADARPEIVQWLRDNNYPELASRYEQNYTNDQEPLQTQNQAVQQQQVQQNAGQSAPIGNPMAGDPNVSESSDPLDFIKSLAGLTK